MALLSQKFLFFVRTENYIGRKGIFAFRCRKSLNPYKCASEQEDALIFRCLKSLNPCKYASEQEKSFILRCRERLNQMQKELSDIKFPLFSQSRCPWLRYNLLVDTEIFIFHHFGMAAQLVNMIFPLFHSLNMISPFGIIFPILFRFTLFEKVSCNVLYFICSQWQCRCFFCNQQVVSNINP